MRSLLDLPPEYVRPEWKTCAVPGRPWWGRNTWGDSWWFRRGDRVTFAPGTIDPTEYDTTNPLPHPGYRVGQVWAWLREPACADGTIRRALPAWVVVSITDSRMLQVMADGWAPMGDGLWHMPDREDSSHILATFLLHDPIRPDLAPWSSV